MSEGDAGKSKESRLPIKELLLDDENPRLPEDLKGASQEDLIRFMVEEYDAITVARSIALHGFFLSEPLIVEEGSNIVFEGNRRLAALKLLKDDELRLKLDLENDEAWDQLSEEARDLETDIPIVLVPNRSSVAPIIGYRHISGIEPWDPWAKARFIASLLRQDVGFEEVATKVGETTNEVKASYRNYQIVEDARKAGLDAERIEKSFGIFTRAMTSGPLRKHVNLPAPSEITKRGKVLSKSSHDKLAELIKWLFGADGIAPVINESRDISTLGTVVGSNDGLKVLRETSNLEEAFVAAGGLRDRLIKRLTRASTELSRADEDLPMYHEDEEVQNLIRDCRSALENLEATINSPS